MQSFSQFAHVFRPAKGLQFCKYIFYALMATLFIFAFYYFIGIAAGQALNELIKTFIKIDNQNALPGRRI